MKKIKKPLSVLLSLIMICVLFTTIPFHVGAEEADRLRYVERTWTNGAVEESEGTVPDDYQMMDTATTALDGSGRWYVASGELTINSRITVSGDVKLLLSNDATLKANKGIVVKKDASLTIYGQSGDSGKLIAKSSDGAAIGALDGTAGGSVIIKGGNIKANGGGKDAGIGAGKGSSGFERIEIYGGTVNAAGGKSGAGIGRGQKNSDSDCGAITIYGGAITAKGGSEAAGIGGGEHSNGGVITINGGSVSAYGGCVVSTDDNSWEYYDSGAAIGGGDGANGGTITINGGSVYAYGNCEGAAIGGGDCGKSGTITINGGNVYAEGVDDGAAIGGGDEGNVDSITITGGIIKAAINSKPGEDTGGAAIGSGDGEDMDGTITITGGTVFAAANQGAGIGSGSEGDQDGNITITGGKVYARSGVLFYCANDWDKSFIPFDNIAPDTFLSLPNTEGREGGAGIGGGRYGNQNGKVTVTGGYVLAVGSNYNNSSGGGAGIGGGDESGSGDGGESTGAFTIGSGAVVEIYAGNESEPLGHGEDGSDKGKIYLDDNYSVYDYNIGAFATASKRNWFCRNKKHHIRIAPCEHPDCSYTYIDLHSHSWQCKNCLSSGTEAHQNNDASSCALCDGTKPIKQVFVYEGVTGDNSGDKPFVYRITLSDVLEGTDFRLPEPSGKSPYYVFEGYKITSGFNSSSQESAVLNDWQAVNTDELTQPGDLITVTGDTAVRAPYKECYTVTFDANGGVGTMNSVIVPKGEAYSLPEGIFERDDERVFTYWQLNGERKDAGTPVTVNSDITLYAQYDYPVHEHDGVAFTPTNSHLAIEKAAGSYYLVDNDVYLPQTLAEGNTTICLNGHDLYLNFDAIKGLDIPAGSTLTIINDKGKGNIVVNIYQNGAQVNNCTAITVHGTLNLCDVDITGFNNIRTTLGGAVCVADGGTFNMDGGEISGNRSQTHGAGVYVANGGTFNVSGTVDISDNVYTGGSEEVPENVYLENGAVINVTGTLAEDAELGVICENATHKTVITNGLSGKGGVENFVSDDESVFIVANESGEAMLRAPLTITVEPTVDGVAEAPATAYAGETVTLTVTPDAMYKVISVTVNGTAITPDNDTYSFVMPEENVTVAATFDFANGIGARLAGNSISIDGDIGVNFYMKLSADTAASDTAYMHFTIPQNGEPATQNILVKDAKKVETGSQTYYVFKCQAAAKEMTSEIRAQIIDGESSGTEYTYSVREYADYLIKHAYDSAAYARAVPLVKKMLNYGAFAQGYFDKNTASLANGGLTDEEKALGDVTVTEPETSANLPEGVTFEGATLSLKSETSLSLYFKSGTALTFSCDGKTVEAASSGGYQIARIRNIPANELKDSFTLSLTAGGADGSVVYSPMNYCGSILRGGTDNEALVSVIKALVLYAQAADTYFSYQPVTVDLGGLAGDYEAKDGEILTGKLSGDKKITIADGATVILRNANITSLSDVAGYAGVTPLGDAAILLEGENTVRGSDHYPAVYAAAGHTLHIGGTGSLNASFGNDGHACGIGGGSNTNAGNIVIHSGDITATGGSYAAAIGGGYDAECGDIVIEGGTVTATGGYGAAGIGIGNFGVCTNITVSGGTVKATGSHSGAGIGSGYSASVKVITISGGTVTATGGENAAAIGSGSEGYYAGVYIENTVTQVTAVAGDGCPYSIGPGNTNGPKYVSVHIGGVYVEAIKESPYTYTPSN